jgi:uncharacterized protein YeaO (DUF488 family)
MKLRIQMKRIYEPASAEDGARVLVDRIWPRGIKKEAAALDLWLKDIAPSTNLRKWYGHKPEKWLEFRKRYKAELTAHKSELEQLIGMVRKGAVTLLYAAHDGEHSNAEVLKEYLLHHLARKA